MRTQFAVVDPAVEAAHARLVAMRTGRYISQQKVEMARQQAEVRALTKGHSINTADATKNGKPVASCIYLTHVESVMHAVQLFCPTSCTFSGPISAKVSMKVTLLGWQIPIFMSNQEAEFQLLSWKLPCQQKPWALLHKTMVTLQLMVSLQSMVTTIATLLHSQSKSRNQ